ncbi:urease accessory protein UreE [Roseobacter sp.]|uniref:urease accessory protein UreE n=1 Tax=Roseobacter sp. TaxID=1907202 RepID=UPI00385E38CE
MLPTAQKVILNGTNVADYVTLDYDARFLRRKVIKTQNGLDVLVDLPKTMSLGEGDVLETTDGMRIGVRAAPEPLLEITGRDLHRIAWHIGNRHTPCQIEEDRLFIQQNHVMAQMLEKLGAHVHQITRPFTPEGGAYGHGRTHGHDHNAQHGPETTHVHAHDH